MATTNVSRAKRGRSSKALPEYCCELQKREGVEKCNKCSQASPRPQNCDYVKGRRTDEASPMPPPPSPPRAADKENNSPLRKKRLSAPPKKWAPSPTQIRVAPDGGGDREVWRQPLSPRNRGGGLGMNATPLATRVPPAHCLSRGEQ